MEPSPDPYRVAPGALPIVVDFRHFSAWWAPVLLALYTVLVVLISHRVTLTCERDFAGNGVCLASDVNMVLRHPRMRFDLATVRSAAVQRHGKGSSLVALVTTEGVVPLSGAADLGDEDAKAAMVHDIQKFVADRAQVRLDTAYGSRWLVSPGLLVVGVLFAALFAVITRRVRVVIDRAARLVRVERSRFPLSPRVEGFDLGKVVGAEVETSEKGAWYRVSLILRGGERVPLTDNYTAGLGRKERAAEAIAEALEG